jgi:hypothetical protein
MVPAEFRSTAEPNALILSEKNLFKCFEARLSYFYTVARPSKGALGLKFQTRVSECVKRTENSKLYYCTQLGIRGNMSASAEQLDYCRLE